MAVTEYTAAPSGAGKSYLRCAVYLATEYLPLKKGKIWTNFPIHIDKMVAYVLEKNPDMVASELEDRIRIIPDDVLKRWRAEESGPWEYFEGVSLEGDRIAIDEIHNFCPKEASRDTTRKWKEFLGEMRHRGVEFECLTQNEAKVHAIIKNEAGLKRTLFNCEDRRDPFTGIPMHDWYNLRAKFITGAYTSAGFEYEYLPLNGRWKENHVRKFFFDPLFYALYDSYSTPVAGGVKARGKTYPFQEHTRLGLLWWFFRKNYFAIIWRFVVVCLFLWVCFGGGAQWLITKFMDAQAQIAKANAPAVAASPHASGTATHGSDAQLSASRPSGAAAVDLREPGPHADPALEQTLRDEQELRRKAEQRLAELEAENERQREIVLLSPLFIILRSGQRIDAGEVVSYGPFKGLTLILINQRKRYAQFSDRSVYYLTD